MEQKHLKTLEFHKILNSLADLVQCTENKDRALKVEPFGNFQKAKTEIENTDETLKLLLQKGNVGLDKIEPIQTTVLRAKKGGTLSLKELLMVDKLCVNTNRLITWYYDDQKEKQENSEVDYLFQNLADTEYLHNEIRAVVINDDEIADRASTELFRIRRQIKQNENTAREIVEKMVRSTTVQKFLQEAIVTIRDGRFVLPVKAEHKGQVPGLVHDTSASGSTLFVEPMSAVEANNSLKVLQGQEQVEINRILEELSKKVGENKDKLLYNYENLIDIDLYLAKAKLAIDMKASKPVLNNQKQINLRKARHPLIDSKVVVPIDVHLGKEFDSLIVTGPNTGGKTVTIKTLGLLTLMALSGLFIPAEEKSEVGFFENVLVDIGDEQSIEQSLSTFSSHMVNIVSILKTADNSSLVLLDELGAGTDPVEGAALAISVIETLREKGSFLCATTHYPELKTYAIDTAGVQNASCSFDLKTLKPTYHLSIGIPGASNAFAISKRLGLSDDIIKRAQGHMDEDAKTMENTIAQMEEQKQKLQREKNKLQKVTRELQDEKNKNKKLNENLSKQLENQQKQANMQTSSLIQKISAQAEQLLDQLEKELKQAKAGQRGASVNSLRKGFFDKLDNLYNLAEPQEKKREYKLPRMPKVGEEVLLMDFDKKAIVQTAPDKNGNLEVLAGIIKTKTNVKNIKLLENKEQVTINKKAHSTTTKNISARKGKMELDVRGLYPEDAIQQVDRFIDDSQLSSIPTVTVIHGKGTGVLKKAIHAHLKKHKGVESYRFGTFGEGEDGVTVIDLK